MIGGEEMGVSLGRFLREAERGVLVWEREGEGGKRKVIYAGADLRIWT